jgi:hypothetical protein
MYKKILKSIKNTSALKKQVFADLYKSEQNPVKARKPHFLFSAENPLYKDKVKLKMTHPEVMDFLKQKGYQVESMDGHYGHPERSILVHNPSKNAARHLFNLASDLGQESSIYSDGYNHELHFHHGENAGKHAKGQGTAIHKKPPEDMYSTMADGTCFTHQINADVMHDRKESVISEKPSSIQKSEGGGRTTLMKNENNHPLKSAGPDTNLIHYSTTPNLTEIDPFHHGVRGIGAEAKQGKPEHPTSFYYLEGTKPEHIVTSGAKAKYVAKLGHHKLYDVGTDPEKIRTQLRESGKTNNPGIYTRAELDSAIKQKGYHGIYNSTLDDTMKNVVAMYHKVPVAAEHKMHPKDFESASAENHHGNAEDLKSARQWAKDNGHPDGSFLHGLARKLGE